LHGSDYVLPYLYRQNPRAAQRGEEVMPSNPPYDDDFSGESINLETGRVRRSGMSDKPEVPQDLRELHQAA
jgi:hypothetical protein